MDATTLATAVVTTLAPFLTEAGKEMAKRAGGAVAEKTAQLYTFLKGKLTSPGVSEALTELEKTPNDEDARTVLQLKLKKLLTDDAQLRDGLAALVQALTPDAGNIAQTAHATGNDNVTIQAAGSGHTVILGDRK